MNKNLVYWLCQIGGWLLYIAFSTSMIAVFGGIAALTQSALLLQLIIFVNLVLFSHLFRLYIQKQKWINLKIIQLTLRVLLGALVVAIAAQGAIHIIIYLILQMKDLAPFSWLAFGGYVVSVYVVLILWSTIYFFIKNTEKSRKSEMEKLALKTDLQEAELMILKNQINPHFLFNALNNIRSLILSDQERARQMVTHISELLRYSIQFNASEKVTLSQEMDIVQDYLQLESIQFNDRLAYVLKIDDDTRDLSIPPMAIQLLVENGIKHGLSIQKNGGFIRIESTRESDSLVIKVTNTGQLGQKQGREGIGIKNLVERMKILFGPFAQFNLENSSKDTVTATLNIPIQ
ncbi:sensor histidine kinase [Roseivirga sp. E12]|uniref:sensor histidine kinase n=1 Tax=Roseivirga sp. E12 TaxID=2819237 RepID=UPI001ABC9A96|nr:histidine kinase [Roseivirga sp. E12]MBO3699188.1 histidine kinase [Roseivirga sp. E12]